MAISKWIALFLVVISSASFGQEGWQKLSFDPWFTGSNYGGRAEEYKGHYVFTTHYNKWCKNSDSPNCKKAYMRVQYLYLKECRETKYEFDLKVKYFNPNYAPDFLILMQDFVKIDELGNHPITTLKLVKINGEMYLTLGDNSWQWNEDNFLPSDPHDNLHKHGLEKWNGKIKFPLGVYNHVVMTIQDNCPDVGRVTMKVNGITVVDTTYQTRHPSNIHAIFFGYYSSAGWNTSRYWWMKSKIIFKNFNIYER